MTFIDRLLTVIITATLTSAIWIVAGGSLIELASQQEGEDSTRPAEAAPSPEPATNAADSAGIADLGASLDTQAAFAPSDEDDVALRIPVLNVRASDLTDTFTDEREGTGRLHEALDIMAPEGTSVVAAGPGVIEKLFTSEAAGNTIYVRSQDRRTIHFYSHLSEYAEGLREGQRVRRGQRLGTVGSTGNAAPDAPHLHFAILRTTADAKWWEPANAVNPYPILAGE